MESVIEANPKTVPNAGCDVVSIVSVGVATQHLVPHLPIKWVWVTRSDWVAYRVTFFDIGPTVAIPLYTDNLCKLNRSHNSTN